MAEVVRTYYDTSELESEVYTGNGKKNGEYKYYYMFVPKKTHKTMSILEYIFITKCLF